MIFSIVDVEGYKKKDVYYNTDLGSIILHVKNIINILDTVYSW